MSHRIVIDPPRVRTGEASFAWRVTPSTELYRSSRFHLRFPTGLDLRHVPERHWWTLALACLHPHWGLLRPCTVHLPVRLRAGEAELWCRLVDAEVATLEAHAGGRDLARAVEIVEEGPPLPALPRLTERGRCATAFSGGKDSLLQVGLLTELTERPLLVTVTSPLPPLRDHRARRRRRVLTEVRRRRDVELIEVESNFRATWDNGFATRARGYWVGVNELTDTFLYFGALLVAAAAGGATHLFLASEAEVQENVSLGGRTIQHHHLMYAATTQRALSALLEPAGMRFGSLTWPLHSYQVQELLWRRYGDLADLQFSCWKVGRRQAACNACSQCLRVALRALALGDDPERMGIELGRLFRNLAGWRPAVQQEAAGDELPGVRVHRALEEEILRSLTAPRSADTLQRLLAEKASGRRGARYRGTWERFARLRAAAAEITARPAPGYRPGFLELLDPLLAAPVGAIFERHFEAASDPRDEAILRRSVETTEWIRQPLESEAEARP